MRDSRREIRLIAAAFGLLFAVSLYRQLSIRFLSGDVIRPFVVFAVYVFLLGGWLHSIALRITQRFMLRCLRIECYIMMFWLFVRLLQDSVLYKNVHTMRVSGYCIVFPWIITLIYGFYAAFGLGKNEDYNLPKNGISCLFRDLYRSQ